MNLLLDMEQPTPWNIFLAYSIFFQRDKSRLKDVTDGADSYYEV